MKGEALVALQGEAQRAAELEAQLAQRGAQLALAEQRVQVRRRLSFYMFLFFFCLLRAAPS